MLVTHFLKIFIYFFCKWHESWYSIKRCSRKWYPTLRLNVCFSYLNCLQKNYMKPNILSIGFELGVMKVRDWGEKGVNWGAGSRSWEKRHFGVITSCQFQFQKQIPLLFQQPSTNSHCQNEHISKVVSFRKGFYDTNKTLKLLTADECGLKKKKVLTIYSHLKGNTYLGK